MAETSGRNAVVTGRPAAWAAPSPKRCSRADAGLSWSTAIRNRFGSSPPKWATTRSRSSSILPTTKAVDRLPDLIPDAFKPVDILINNAGHDIGGRTRFDIGPADDWSAHHPDQPDRPDAGDPQPPARHGQRNAGHIVNISSINAVRIVPDMAAYSTSKAGVHMFTETLRGELAETAIRVTEMQPGLTRTNIILTRYRGDRARRKRTISTSSSWRSIRPTSPDRSCLHWTSRRMFRLRR